MLRKVALAAIVMSLIVVSAFLVTQNQPADTPEIHDEIKTKPRPETPITKPIIIVIDPGHGKFISLEKEPNAPGSSIMKAKSVVGASGNVSRVAERDINLIVALQLRNLLDHAGYQVIMTHVDNSTNPSNIERITIANDVKADLMIRIHNDSSTNTAIHGASVLVPGNVGYAGPIVDISRQYGTIILDTLIDQMGMADRGVITRKDQTGFNWSHVPVITVEMGFLSNANEEQHLINPAYQIHLANALFRGIQICFRSDIEIDVPIQ